MNLNQNDVVVIQHQDKSPSGEVIHSTTIKVKTQVDGEERLFILLSDTFIPVSDRVDDSSTLDWKLIKEVWKKIGKAVKKEFPDKDTEAADTITSDILYTIQGTNRRTTQIFHWPEWRYSQIRSVWNYLN